jgi:hypothetical protein
VIIPSAVSNVLAENKLFPVALLLLAVATAGLLVARGSQAWRLVLFAALIALGGYLFSIGYNILIPTAEKRPIEQFLLDDDTRNQYLNRVRRPTSRDYQTFTIGRNGAMAYALSTIQGDPVTLFFGVGLGGRRQSESLGVSGTQLQQDRFGRGSDLVVIVQEMGLLALAVALGAAAAISVALFRIIRRSPDSPATGLCYALFLFSVLWPLWLWYKRPLDSRAVMMLYWLALGYVLGRQHAQSARDAESGPASPALYGNG